MEAMDKIVERLEYAARRLNGKTFYWHVKKSKLSNKAAKLHSFHIVILKNANFRSASISG